MSSRVESGAIQSRVEPHKNQSYEVLETPSKVTLDFVPGSLFETTFEGIREVNAVILVKDLNAVRLPLDANPRQPEHLPVVEDIRASATDLEKSKRFVYMNNGIDVFCQSVSPLSGTEAAEPTTNTLSIEFGGPEAHDGICNGGVTYYALQGLPALTGEPAVKVRFYQFEGADLALKAAIAQAKNRNRAVSTTDDANFMGYFDRLKEKLGPLTDRVKWSTGDTDVISGDFAPLSIADLIRFLSALRIEESYHWALNRSAEVLRSHVKREDLLRQAKSHADKFVKNMSSEEE